MIERASAARRIPTPSCDDTEHLRSSRANEARLNAAIEELDAGCGMLTSMSELQNRLRDLTSDPESEIER